MPAHGRRLVSLLQEYSIPLILGVFCALAAANLDYEWYHAVVDGSWGFSLLGHDVTLHFVINDLFMVLFFGVAAKEITEAVLPGGALNPPSRAINPLLGTIGGVVGPVGVFFVLTWALYAGEPELPLVANGWGVPTATDIALAWLVARLVFGPRHPAVNFLLLLAVADDAIGLGIIAIAYPNPEYPVAPAMLGFTGAGMGVAYALRRLDVQTWLPYVLLAGGLAWFGLISAHLHPALALVFIVPFMPAPRRDAGLFQSDAYEPAAAAATGTGDVPSSAHHDQTHATLEEFEHAVKGFVDFGLFFFAFANAGVPFANIGPVTWIILASLVVGKTLGISLFSWAGVKIGFALPEGMTVRELAVAGLVAGLGLTVALFVAGEAYSGPDYAAHPAMLGEAKMGALFSGGVALLAILVARALGVRPRRD